MKKFIAVLMIVVLLVAGIGLAKVAKVNKMRYWVEAYCEYENGELVFTFCGEEFVWELGEGDKIPKGHHVVLLMENNGTEGFLQDDEIISYK
jgi:hypothetical protein